MRSVPHRVVCLLGLDDGVFPRQGSVDGDDVLARDPLTGERDARSEDRQLLLDAILAATQTLVVTYTGANEFSGPAATTRRTAGRGARRPRPDRRDRATAGRCRRRSPIHHPLQPFDARNVDARRRWSPARRSPSTARPRPGPGPPPGRGCAAPRSSTRPAAAGRAGDVPLADLVRFWGDPVRGFLAATASTSRCRRRGAARGRAAGRDRQPGPVGRRRPGARRPAGGARRPTSSSSASGGVACCRPGSSAGGCSARSSTQGRAARGEPPTRCARRRRARSTSRSTWAAGAGCVGTVPEVYGDRLVPVTLLPARRQAPPGLVGPAARPGRVRRRPQLDRPHLGPAHTAGRGTTHGDSLLGPLDHTAVDCCATWSRCATAGCANRCRCRSRPRSRYARARRTRADVPDALVKAGYDWRDGRFRRASPTPRGPPIWGPVDEPARGRRGAGRRARSSPARPAGSARWRCGCGAR